MCGIHTFVAQATHTHKSPWPASPAWSLPLKTPHTPLPAASSLALGKIETLDTQQPALSLSIASLVSVPPQLSFWGTHHSCPSDWRLKTPTRSSVVLRPLTHSSSWHHRPVTYTPSPTPVENRYSDRRWIISNCVAKKSSRIHKWMNYKSRMSGQLIWFFRLFGFFLLDDHITLYSILLYCRGFLCTYFLIIL